MQNGRKGEDKMETDNTASLPEVGADDLERYALEECVKRHRISTGVSVLVAPAGRNDVAAKFARLGARVTVADHEAMRREVHGRALASGFGDEISFVAFQGTADIASFPDNSFDIAFLRRGLCALPYPEAREALRQLLHKMKIGGKLYVSVLGLHSALGEGYGGSEQLIEERFQPLAPKVADKYELHDPVCLYTERNLFMLFLESGASVLRTLTTTYGNVQGIAVRV